MNTASENAWNARNTQHSYHVQDNERGSKPILSTVFINLAYTLVMVLFGVVGWQKLLTVGIVLQNKYMSRKTALIQKSVKFEMSRHFLRCMQFHSFQRGSWPLCCGTGHHSPLSWGIVPVSTVWRSLHLAYPIFHDACSQPKPIRGYCLALNQ